MRYLSVLEYDGSAYAGWQWQKNGPSVQEAIETALKKAIGQDIRVTGASRTDAGVHARGQAAHFDCETSIPPGKLPYAVNRHLPGDVRMLSCQEAPGVHARFDAKAKRYSYLIRNASHASALLRGRSAFVPGLLDVRAMQVAADAFIGTRDFACAMAQNGSAKTTVRTIFDFSVERHGEWIMLSIAGDGFLYNMVRILAGTLICSGQGKLGLAQIELALATRDRKLLGFTAPAAGLTLERVFFTDYDPERPDNVENGYFCGILT